MKRIAYLFDDKKFDGVYEKMREYFRNRESVKEPLGLVTAAEPTTPLHDGAKLIAELRRKVKEIEAGGTALVLTLDSQYEALGRAAELFAAIRPEHLVATGQERERNLRTLNDIRRHCNLA